MRRKRLCSLSTIAKLNASDPATSMANTAVPFIEPPFFTVSDISENIEIERQKKSRRPLQEALHPPSHAQQREHERMGQLLHVLVPLVQHLEEFQGRFDSLLRVRACLRIGLGNAFAQQRERGVDLAP